MSQKEYIVIARPKHPRLPTDTLLLALGAPDQDYAAAAAAALWLGCRSDDSALQAILKAVQVFEVKPGTPGADAARVEQLFQEWRTKQQAELRPTTQASVGGSSR